MEGNCFIGMVAPSILSFLLSLSARMMPICGYHGGLAAMFGIHHYIYYYDWRGGEVLDSMQFASQSKLFYEQVRNK
jgi:hypothetical protein